MEPLTTATMPTLSTTPSDQEDSYATAASPSSSELPAHPASALDFAMLRCPIMDELMADPVVAADGLTYEAENIQKAWAAARERAEEPQEEHEACCGAAAAPFVLRSPMTNEPMTSELLTPNFLVVQIIEAIIESGNVPPEEAYEWRTRRKAAVAKRKSQPPPQATDGTEGELSQLVATALKAPLHPPRGRRSLARSVSLSLRRARDGVRERASRANERVLDNATGWWRVLRQKMDARRQRAAERKAEAQLQQEQAQRQQEQRSAAQREADAATAAYLSRIDPFTGMPVQAGDLRMCGRCHAGPWRKTGCNDMSRHNTWFGSHTANATHNRCRNCGWLSSDWTNWPVWDGVVGPH